MNTMAVYSNNLCDSNNNASPNRIEGVVQARLKKSGAWWKTENAEKMLSLRVCRANGEWSSYWQQIRQAAA
jgi:hypothetical protein